LADLVLLDTRVWGRQRQLASTADPALRDVHRTLLGADQEAWLGNQLSASRARWRLIGNQVMVGSYPIETNLDTWDGYPAARKRFVAQLRASQDTVVLTGDVHSSWAMNILDEPLDPGSNDAADDTDPSPVAVEFVTPGITSPLLDRAGGEAWQPKVLMQPHVKYVQLWRRGYMVLDVDASRVQAAWYHYDAVDQPDPVDASFGGAAAVYSGERSVRLETEAAPAREPLAAAAAASAA
jgi:alkaline phosphatase D